MAMKPGNKIKYKEFCAKLTKLYEDNKPKPSSDVPLMELKLEPFDDKITCKFMVVEPESTKPLLKNDIPLGLIEGLKDVD